MNCAAALPSVSLKGKKQREGSSVEMRQNYSAEAGKMSERYSKNTDATGDNLMRLLSACGCVSFARFGYSPQFIGVMERTSQPLTPRPQSLTA